MRVAVPALMVIMLIAFAFELQAHVTVQPKEVSAKSNQEFLVRVPTEKDQPTTSIKIVFPEGFELLRVRPTSGWKYELERDASGRIASVTWSGGRVGRGEYEVFTFIARAPAPGTFKLDAYQTYGEHDVVAWVNAAEPRPAPQVKVGGADLDAVAAVTHPVAASATPAVSTADRAAGGRNPSVILSGASLIVALAAFFMSWRASRRPRV